MLERALSGSSQVSSHSPHTTSQEDIDQEKISQRNGFPTNNQEFLRYLLFDKSPGEITAEMEMARLDTVRAGFEWMQLRFSSTFQGIGLPRGEGVVVIAGGFATTKLNYQDTAHVFEKLGYTPVVYIPKPGINFSPVEQNENEFMDLLNSFSEKVFLITHSKGGLQAYAAYATRRKEFSSRVKHWVQVAAPRPDWVNFVIGAPYLGTQFVFGGDDFKFADEILGNVDIENIDGVQVTAIGNPRDPIIRGKMIGKPDEQFLTDSSHSGALYYLKNLKLIAHRLAESASIQAKAA